MTVAAGDWLRVIADDYLAGFVGEGGSSVKIAIPGPNSPDVASRLLDKARADGYLAVSVDSATTRIDKIDHAFGAVAKQVDWRHLSEVVRLRAVAESGYAVPEPGEPVTYESIARAAGADMVFVRKNLQDWFTDNVFRDYQMTQDFRKAMTWLCSAPLDGPGATDDGLFEALVEWLEVQLRLMSRVRRAQVYQKIARHNARDMFVSLGYWTRVANYRGLVIVFDLRHAVVTPRGDPAEGRQGYTRAAVMDLYEVLRQFIDSADEIDSTLIVAVAPAEFVEDERRGVEIYRALQMRVAEEVRDRQRDNPLATLVRVD